MRRFRICVLGYVGVAHVRGMWDRVFSVVILLRYHHPEYAACVRYRRLLGMGPILESRLVRGFRVFLHGLRYEYGWTQY
ncbi:hypothetical protein DFP72DRAFT_900644 [Ephemerocybe angulata]|uniref:Uncharacterized protein n=1 Tax=Ephemerocybe angulata TaxID=980116 RepID=A0A8H6M6D7_9AGAR|nr:hypothetical protein DFP72DRAFT_900644 [Tulosesus angulatus]